MNFSLALKRTHVNQSSVRPAWLEGRWSRIGSGFDKLIPNGMSGFDKAGRSHAKTIR